MKKETDQVQIPYGPPKEAGIIYFNREDPQGKQKIKRVPLLRENNTLAPISLI